MKTETKKKQLVTKKQKEFFDFVESKVMPFFEGFNIKFDTINPTINQDEWAGDDILVTIPYGEKMEPWLCRAINECYTYLNKTIYVICGAKVNTNAWHKYVFPFAERVAFVRRGKRPTAIIKYTNGCETKSFVHTCGNTIAYTMDCMGTNIDDYMLKNLLMDDNEK